jgi:hypothetical protein
MEAPPVKSLTTWSVDAAGDNEVRFQLTDKAEARAWAQWLMARSEDAVDEL